MSEPLFSQNGRRITFYCGLGSTNCYARQGSNEELIITDGDVLTALGLVFAARADLADVFEQAHWTRSYAQETADILGAVRFQGTSSSQPRVKIDVDVSECRLEFYGEFLKVTLPTHWFLNRLLDFLARHPQLPEISAARLNASALREGWAEFARTRSSPSGR